jgi:hypothetical protein
VVGWHAGAGEDALSESAVGGLGGGAILLLWRSKRRNVSKFVDGNQISILFAIIS